MGTELVIDTAAHRRPAAELHRSTQRPARAITRDVAEPYRSSYGPSTVATGQSRIQRSTDHAGAEPWPTRPAPGTSRIESAPRSADGWRWNRLSGRSQQSLRVRAGSFRYTAVAPNRIKGFPNPMGQTDLDRIPAAPRLDVAELGSRGDDVRTVILDTPVTYDSEANTSMGAAAGRFHYGMAPCRNGTWTGELSKWTDLRNFRWAAGAPPADGIYQLWLEVTDDDATTIAEREKEHRDDFLLAWRLTIDRARRLAIGVPWLDAGGGPDAPVAALVDAALQADSRWLVPATPDRVDTWGPHLRAQFTELAGQSTKRDDQRQHSPVEYVARVEGNAIILRFIVGGAQPSAKYIVAKELPTPFSAGSFKGYRADEAARAEAQRSMAGKKVSFTGAAPTEAYQAPNARADCLADGPAVAKGLAGDVVFSSLDPDGVHAWVKVAAVGYLKYVEDSTGSVYLRVPNNSLKPL